VVSGKVLALVILSRAKTEEEERSALHMEGKIIFLALCWSTES